MTNKSDPVYYYEYPSYYYEHPVLNHTTIKIIVSKKDFDILGDIDHPEYTKTVKRVQNEKNRPKILRHS